MFRFMHRRELEIFKSDDLGKIKRLRARIFFVIAIFWHGKSKSCINILEACGWKEIV